MQRFFHVSTRQIYQMTDSMDIQKKVESDKRIFASKNNYFSSKPRHGAQTFSREETIERISSSCKSA
jgi:hypothetical protein